jgi:hypothetical protein
MQIAGGHCGSHVAIGVQLSSAALARGNVRLDLTDMPGVELVIEQCVKKNLGLVAGHLYGSSSAIHAIRSIARARARRDITVPMGAPTMSEISR